MPKVVDCYKLKPIKNLVIDGMEHFLGQQIDSNKKFILKRCITDLDRNFSFSKNKQSTSPEINLLEKLIHQTLILKVISHPSIPKCLRMLKTRKILYFVWENHPQTSLEFYLTTSWMKIEQKILISIKILQILAFLHQNKIAYRGLSSKNITIDQNLNIFFTDFKNAVKQEQGFSRTSFSKGKLKQFNFLITEDCYDATGVLFEIFQFKTINPKLYLFWNSIEKKTYEELNLILEKKITPTLQGLKKLFSDKTNISQTQCTETEQAIISPRVIGSFIKKEKSQEILKVKQNCQNRKYSDSSAKMTLRDALKRAQISRNQKFKINNHKKQQKLIKMMNSSSFKQITLSIRKNYQPKQNLKKQFLSIIKQRKLVQFSLKLIEFGQRIDNSWLAYLIGLKCRQYAQKLQNMIDQSSCNLSNSKQINFLRIINEENTKTQALVMRLKLVVKDTADQKNDRLGLQKFQKRQGALQKTNKRLVEEELGTEILEFLRRQMKQIKEQKKIETLQRPQYPRKSTQFLSKTKFKSQSISKLAKITSAKNSIGEVVVDVANDYENCKYCYFLSTKLKYGSFEKFFERADLENEHIGLSQDPYFRQFQKKTISVIDLVKKIVNRIEKPLLIKKR